MALHGKNDMAQMIKCIYFAADKHKHQRRKDSSSTPFINHPIGVAHILTNEGNVQEMNVILAAILHDTVEDTDTTFDELAFHFGEKVSEIVKECTDNKELPKEKRKTQQILSAKSSSKEAKLVKLADKLYNLRDLDTEIPKGWSAERVSEYFKWSWDVVSGLKGVNVDIERKLDELFVKHGINIKD